MRKIEMASNKIFILGAGSSIGHSGGSFPSITEFFSHAKDFGLYSKNKFENLAKYTKQNMGYNIYSTKKQIDIEALMTHVEIELERRSSPRLLGIRQELVELIQLVLITAETRSTTRNNEYELLRKRLGDKDTIITFNWDLLLDNVLNRMPILQSYQENTKDLRKYKSGQYYRFILDLSAIGEKTWDSVFIREPYREWNSPAGYYLKVHGSIDWYYCSNESCRFFRKVFPVLNPSVTYYCSECHEQLERLLIPPVLNKEYKQYPLLRRIWNLAAKEISLAEEIVIWGYSMPPTDFYSAWLLRQCQKKSLMKLTIINPAVKTKNNTVASGFVRHFYELFRRKIEKDSLFLFENFSDFDNSQDILTKYNLGPAKISYSKI
jgi:hypothetical protein